MTEPTSQLFTPDMAAQYTKVLGYHPTFSTRPNIAGALAKSGATDDELDIVAGFLSSLDLAKSVRLARTGGAKVSLSNQDRAYLQVIGEKFDDVDLAPAVATAQAHMEKAAEAQREAVKASGIPSGVFGKVAHGLAVGVTKVTNAPVISPVLKGLDIAADTTRGILRTPFASTALGLPGDPIGDAVENTVGMKERGYDPTNPISVFAFYSEGEQNYHNLNDLRKQYGEGAVKAAQQYIEKPEDFTNYEGLSDADITGRLQASNTPDFKRVVDLVSSRHMSLGRDFANAVKLDPGTKPFTVVSGGLDALESWFVDPTIVGGKAGQAVRLSRRGIDSLVDAEGIRRVMKDKRAIQRGWQQLLDRSATIRTGTDVEKAAAYAAIRMATSDLVPLVDEINGVARRAVVEGQTVVQAGPAITNLADLTDYLVAQNGLVRTLRGAPPVRGVYMPGALSRFGAMKAKAAEGLLKGAAVRHEDRMVDLVKDGYKAFPNPDDFITATAQASAVRGAALAADRASFGGRWRTAAKRFSTLMPDQTKLDYYDPKAADQLLKWAQIYMPKTEARVLVARFTASDLAGRRQIVKGMYEQVIHAAGLETTATGRQMAAQLRGDVEAYGKQQYSLRDGADILVDDAGRRHAAVAPGQVDTELWLPGYNQLQAGAAKVSFYDHTLRRVLDNEKVDKVLKGIRAGWLMTFSNAERNVLENTANAAVRGQGLATARAALTMSEATAYRMLRRELPDLEDEANWASKAKYHKARLSRQLQQVKLQTLRKVLPEDEFLKESAEILAGELAEGHLSKLGWLPSGLVSGAVDPRSPEAVAEITNAGFRPSEISFRNLTHTWGEVASNGEHGARAWAINLDHFVGQTPVLGDRLVKAIRAQHYTKGGIGAIHASPEMERLVNHIAVHPEMAKYREFAEHARAMKQAPAPEAVTAHGFVRAQDMVAIEGARHVADRMLASFEELVTDKNGNLVQDLLDRLEVGQVPSLEWFSKHIPSSERPDKLIGRIWTATPANAPEPGAVAQVGQTVGRLYMESLSKGYDAFVSGPIAKLSSHPMFAANFSRARRNLKGYKENLIAAGMPEEAAKLNETKLALDHAMDMTSRMIDNPEVASQMATISRNLVNFPRAAEDWVRRWGKTLMEDPSRIRKIQMAFEGGQHAGIIDRNDQGQLIFTYPGSGGAINALIKAGEALKIPGMVSIPTIPDLSSQVMFINPSLDNPFWPGFSPVVTTPFKIFAAFMPEHELFWQDMQTAATGSERGASQGIFEQFFPTVVRNMFKALTADEQNAQLASAQANAIVHLDAAGHSLPANATPDEVDQYLQRIRTAAKNQLVFRAIFAFALPATPSLPENEAADGQAQADFAFQGMGIHSLKDEARILVAQLGYERALSVWTKVHPDELAYLVGRTQSGSPYGSVSPTRGAQEWIEQNSKFVNEHPSMAAYFIPDAPGDFSPEAYRAQLELGLRERKDMHKFYSDVRIINAEREYYAAKEKRDTAIAQAKGSGDMDKVKALKAGWTAWTQGDGQQAGFLNLNPLFAQKLASYGERTEWRKQAVGELNQMLSSDAFGSVKGLDQTVKDGVAGMVQAYNAHTAYTDRMRTRRDADSTVAKQAEQAAYEKHMLALTGSHYGEDGRLTGGSTALTDLYQGVFRGLD